MPLELLLELLELEVPMVVDAVAPLLVLVLVPDAELLLAAPEEPVVVVPTVVLEPELDEVRLVVLELEWVVPPVELLAVMVVALADPVLPVDRVPPVEAAVVPLQAANTAMPTHEAATRVVAWDFETIGLVACIWLPAPARPRNSRSQS